MKGTDRILFFGTGGLLSSTCLNALIRSDKKPVLVVMQNTESPYPNLTKIICENAGIPCLLVDSVNSNDALEQLTAHHANFAIVASFGEIFKQELLNLFPIYNVHMGVLPHFRGAYTNFWKILNNDDVYGVTIHQMEEKVDSGNIILIREQDFSTVVFAGDFFKMNYEMAAEALIDAIELIQKQVFPAYMDNSSGKYYRKHTAADMVLNPHESVHHLNKKINRLQFYGNPTIEGLRLTSAEMLLDQALNIDSFELISISENSTILKNQSGIVLLKHHSIK